MMVTVDAVRVKLGHLLGFWNLLGICQREGYRINYLVSS